MPKIKTKLVEIDEARNIAKLEQENEQLKREMPKDKMDTDKAIKERERGMNIVSKEVAYWTNIVTNLKNAIDVDTKALRWNKLCLDMAEEYLKNAP